MRTLDPVAALRLARVVDTGVTIQGVDYSVGKIASRGGAFGLMGAAIGGLLGAAGAKLTGQPHPGTHALMAAAGGFAGGAVAGVWSAIFDEQASSVVK